MTAHVTQHRWQSEAGLLGARSAPGHLSLARRPPPRRAPWTRACAQQLYTALCAPLPAARAFRPSSENRRPAGRSGLPLCLRHRSWSLTHVRGRWDGQEPGHLSEEGVAAVGTDEGSRQSLGRVLRGRPSLSEDRAAGVLEKGQVVVCVRVLQPHRVPGFPQRAERSHESSGSRVQFL